MWSRVDQADLFNVLLLPHIAIPLREKLCLSLRRCPTAFHGCHCFFFFLFICFVLFWLMWPQTVTGVTVRGKSLRNNISVITDRCCVTDRISEFPIQYDENDKKHSRCGGVKIKTKDNLSEKIITERKKNTICSQQFRSNQMPGKML